MPSPTTLMVSILTPFIVLAMFAGAMFVLSQALDERAMNSIEQTRCLKTASNGLEIEQCR